MLLEKDSKFMLFGDSVTDMNRLPAGEGLFEALGTGYPADLNSLLTIGYPEYRIRVINKGVGGNTSRDLVARFDQDVRPYRPETLTILIGINDVWRQFDSPLMAEAAVQPEEYRQNLEELISRSKEFVHRLVLITPYYMEPCRSDPMRARMDEYGAIVKELGGKHGLLVIDMQAAFDRLFTHMHSSAIAWDRVHPNSVGAMFMARTILDALEYDWNRR